MAKLVEGNISIPITLLDKCKYPNLSAKAGLLYGYLLLLFSVTDENDGRKFVYFSLKEIAETFSCTIATAARMIQQLADAKLIQHKKADFGGVRRFYLDFEENIHDTA